MAARPGSALPAAADTPESLSGVRHRVFWDDDPARPDVLPGLTAPTATDLVVIGGGYLGLWSALIAVQREPGRSVLVIERERCGHAASGRNGGFCEASLTHGFGNGMARWPEEMSTLLRLGRENLDAIEATVREEGIDCDFQRSGTLSVATAAHQVADLLADHQQAQAVGHQVDLLDADAVRARVDSPTYHGALADPEAAILEPARLVWGLREACLRRGVRIVEGSHAAGLRREGSRIKVAVRSAFGAFTVEARQAVLATNAYRPLLRRLGLMAVPVWDYALMTEPLTTDQRTAIGWRGREVISDRTNQFHYYRTTRDGRILWGGYDAIYRYGSGRRSAFEHRPATYRTLADTFAATFPQLAEVRFSHAWGGMIDTCTRFVAFHGTALGGNAAYALGFTGLGVGATRFAAEVALDQLSGRATERTELRMVRERPQPFPPEPARWLGVQATRWSLAQADRRQGRENLWLRTLNRIGWGFDS